MRRSTKRFHADFKLDLFGPKAFGTYGEHFSAWVPSSAKKSESPSQSVSGLRSRRSESNKVLQDRTNRAREPKAPPVYYASDRPIMRAKLLLGPSNGGNHRRCSSVSNRRAQLKVLLEPIREEHPLLLQQHQVVPVQLRCAQTRKCNNILRPDFLNWSERMIKKLSPRICRTSSTLRFFARIKDKCRRQST